MSRVSTFTTTWRRGLNGYVMSKEAATHLQFVGYLPRRAKMVLDIVKEPHEAVQIDILLNNHVEDVVLGRLLPDEEADDAVILAGGKLSCHPSVSEVWVGY